MRLRSCAFWANAQHNKRNGTRLRRVFRTRLGTIIVACVFQVQPLIRHTLDTWKRPPCAKSEPVCGRNSFDFARAGLSAPLAWTSGPGKTPSSAADSSVRPHTNQIRPAQTTESRPISNEVAGFLVRDWAAQNEILPPICQYLGMRAPVALPKFPSSKCVFIVDRFARLKRLKTSNRNWKLTLSVMRVSL